MDGVDLCDGKPPPLESDPVDSDIAQRFACRPDVGGDALPDQATPGNEAMPPDADELLYADLSLDDDVVL